MFDRKSELDNRLTAKRKELEAKLAKAKADAQGEVNDRTEQLNSRLDQINKVLKEGWDNVSEDVAATVNKLLREEHQHQ